MTVDSFAPPLTRYASPNELALVAHQIGATVAAPLAEEVDRDARFPIEAITALRDANLVSAFVPVEFGGAGCSVAELAAICTALGQYCSATGMVYAMHQIQVACIVRHARTSPYFKQYLCEMVERQPIIASATSEVGIGGDVRSSSCAIIRAAPLDGLGAAFSLTKQAPVISYGAHADDILATARRNPDAAASDQLLVLLRRDGTTLTPLNGWDTLGFRGTCSLGFTLTGKGGEDQIIPVPYAEISQQTMLPVSHIVWAALWLGIATSAINRARTYIRAEARKNPGKAPAASVRLAEAMSNLQAMRAGVNDAAWEYERVQHDPNVLAGMGFAIRMNNLKLATSKAVVDVVTQAMLICGMTGYKNDSPYSLGRHLRDAYGAAIMINNDRIYGANASMLLVHKDD